MMPPTPQQTLAVVDPGYAVANRDGGARKQLECS